MPLWFNERLNFEADESLYIKDGRETTEDNKHTGQPVTVTNERKVDSPF